MSNSLQRLRRRVTRPRVAEPPRPVPATTERSAVVEVFERREFAGWIDAAPGEGPLRVELCVNDVPVAKTWAAPGTGRRAHGELLRFRFSVNHLWNYTKRTDRVSLRLDGRPLPIPKKGTYYHPRQDGAQSLDSLLKKLEAGYVFGQSGRLQLSKSVDTQWQGDVLGLYQRINAVMEQEFGIKAFLCYGTLLGAVRDNGFIGHDLDFDCAYISTKRTGHAAAEELGDISFALMEHGFNVVAKRTCIAVNDDKTPDCDVDIFHLYQDESGRLNFPFGIAGEPKESDGDFREVRPFQLAGHEALVPADAERMVELIYGANWRTPNPGFRWQNDRTVRAREGIVSVAQVDEVARANIAPSQQDARAALLAALSSNDDLPELVVEIGSSLGDDSAAIAQSGKRVIGLERTAMSVARAAKRVEERGLRPQAEFRTVEINDPQQVAAAVAKIRQEVDGANIAFYATSYLDYSDRALHAAIASIDSCGRPGDYLIADFRTAPANRWPKNKDPDATPPWTRADLLAELERGSHWTVAPEKSDGKETGQTDDRTGVVVARLG